MARKEKKYHYIYKITCLRNERYYIGMHSTDNLEDGYMGGGKRIKNSVKKHGKDAHRKEILEFFENREDLRNREIQLVNEELLNDPMCINLNKGGDGGWLKEWSTKGAISANEKNWKDPEFREKMKEVSRKTFIRLWGILNIGKNLSSLSEIHLKERNIQTRLKKRLGNLILLDKKEIIILNTEKYGFITMNLRSIKKSEKKN